MNIRLASFDIGYCNFAQYIEEFDANNMFKLEKEYKKLPKKKQRRMGGPVCDEIADLLKKTALCGKRIQTGVYNLTGEESELNLTTRKNLLLHLHSFEYLWETVDIFIIESQFFRTPAFGKKGPRRGAASEGNIDAIKLAEAVFMWFLDNYPFKTIVYFVKRAPVMELFFYYIVLQLKYSNYMRILSQHFFELQ